MILDGRTGRGRGRYFMYNRKKNRNDKKVFRAGEDSPKENITAESPADEPAAAVTENAPAETSGSRAQQTSEQTKAAAAPENGAAEGEVDPAVAGMYEQLITDGLRYRIKLVGKWIACMFLVLTMGLSAVVFLMRPVPVDTMREADPEFHDIKTEDDFYGGKKEFVSQELKDAHAANSDVVGWLTLDGCEIDDRVMQSNDNDFYLRRNEEGRYSVWGCYFMDFINVHSGSNLYDRVTIIYGHSSGNSSNGNKFSKIKRYRDESFAEEHPVITLSLLYRELKWEVFACSDVPITINYIDPDPSEKEFRDTISYLISHSYVDFGVDVKDDDKILILSTCTSDEYVRYVLAARLIND